MEGAGWEGRAGGGRRMGSHLWNRSDSLTQPNSSLEKLTREEEESLRMEELLREAEKRLN